MVGNTRRNKNFHTSISLVGFFSTRDPLVRDGMSGTEKIESYFNLQNITWNAITIKFWTKTKKVTMNNQRNRL